MNTLKTLIEHLTSADTAARDSIRTLETGSAEHEQVRLLYAHIAGSEHIWLARLRGRPEPYPVWPDLELDRAAEIAAEAAVELRELVDHLGPEGRDREVVYRNSSGREFRNRVEDVLLHVALHGMYHRGQIAQLVRRGGGEPASTDYIAFIRGAAAPTHEKGAPLE